MIAVVQDHVVSPFEGVPADGAGCHVAGSKCEEHFDFRRLGPRGSALLISPWVEKGTVFQVDLCCWTSFAMLIDSVADRSSSPARALI